MCVCVFGFRLTQSHFLASNYDAIPLCVCVSITTGTVPGSFSKPVVSVGVCYTAVDAAAGGSTMGWWAVVLECLSSHPLWHLQVSCKTSLRKGKEIPNPIPASPSVCSYEIRTNHASSSRTTTPPHRAYPQASFKTGSSAQGQRG